MSVLDNPNIRPSIEFCNDVLSLIIHSLSIIFLLEFIEISIYSPLNNFTIYSILLCYLLFKIEIFDIGDTRMLAHIEKIYFIDKMINFKLCSLSLIKLYLILYPYIFGACLWIIYKVILTSAHYIPTPLNFILVIVYISWS